MRRLLLLLLLVASCKKTSVEASPSASASASAVPTASASAIVDAGPVIQYLADIPKEFAKAHSCPEDRVVVKMRPEIDVMQFHKRKSKPLTDEIKADPERYAKWKSDDDADEASNRRWYSDRHVFEVSGCNITELQDCGEYHNMRGGRIPWSADCKVIKLPDAGK